MSVFSTEIESEAIEALLPAGSGGLRRRACDMAGKVAA